MAAVAAGKAPPQDLEMTSRCLGCAVFGQEHALVLAPRPYPLLGIGGQPAGDDLGARHVPVVAGGERAGRIEETRPVELGIGRGRVPYLLHPHALRQIEGVVDRRDHPLDLAACAREQGAKPQPVLAQRVQAFGQRRLPEQHREAAKRGADVGAVARQHLGLRRPQQFRGAARIEHLEMGRHLGLQREALEERLTEAVDGHDRQARGQVEDLGEQRARALPLAGARRSPEQGRELLVQLGLRRGGEPAQVLLHAPHHLGRRGLGEGQAQQLARVAAREQQTQHPVGEHPGLARAGGRGDPDRAGRVGGAPLGGRGRLPAPRPGRAHNVHSPRRARWS